MRSILLYIATVLILSACSTRPKEKLEFGEIILTENGMILPWAKEPGSHTPTWDISLSFEPKYAVIRSPKPLQSCYISFAYTLPDGMNRSLVITDLDFFDLRNGTYIYAQSYPWFPPKALVERSFQISVYYAPQDVEIPTRKMTDGEDEICYQDFSGYFFCFNESESKKYFRALSYHLQ